jgi:hypothetical protein
MTKKSFYFVEGWEKPREFPTSIKGKRIMIALPERKYGIDEDIAKEYAKKKLKRKLTGGSTNNCKDWAVKCSKVINVPKPFIKKYLKNPPVKKPDFIDRLIAYEGGETTTEEDNALLEEVERKGLGNKLQGHYGRAIARKNALKGQLKKEGGAWK